LLSFLLIGLSDVGLLQAANFSDLGNAAGSLVILSFAVLTQYLVPPFGLGVIPLFFSGLYFLLFRKIRWVLDALVLVITITAFAFMLSLAVRMSQSIGGRLTLPDSVALMVIDDVFFEKSN
jgi:hypothetical protein